MLLRVNSALSPLRCALLANILPLALISPEAVICLISKSPLALILTEAVILLSTNKGISVFSMFPAEFLNPNTTLSLLFIISILIMSQPDLGSTAIVCILVVGILFYAGISFFQLGLLILLIVLLGYLAITTSPMRLARVLAFTDPFAADVVLNAGWQLSNSLISIGQGGWFGVGLGNSFQKSFFLPEAHTDFIFAILVEELGIIGGMVLILLFIVLFVGLISISYDSFRKNRYFQGYVVFGTFLLISIQMLFNIAVNIGLLPTKGLTLPFISYGGTSIIIMLSLMGIVLRINNENKLL